MFEVSGSSLGSGEVQGPLRGIQGSLEEEKKIYGTFKKWK